MHGFAQSGERIRLQLLQMRIHGANVSDKRRDFSTACGCRLLLRLIASKFAYFYVGFSGVLTFLQKYHIIYIENFDELMSWIGLLFAVLTVYRFIIVIGAMPHFPPKP